MKIRCLICVAVCLVFLSLHEDAWGNIRLPVLISDGMVLQRDIKLNIWGWGSPGEKVRVKFYGKTFNSLTDREGNWKMVLPPMKAGGPYTMEVKGDNTIIIKDILIGDVWFCSGQSNMVLTMERVKEKYTEDIAGASYPEIRNFFVRTASDVTKVYDDLPPGKWISASPENVLSFSAVAFFFARRIYNEYKIPIGIINSSVGGTPIEAWISEEGFKEFPQAVARIESFKDTAFVNPILRAPALRTASIRAASDKAEVKDKGLTGPKPWYDPEYDPVNDPQGWHNFWLPGYLDDQGEANTGKPQEYNQLLSVLMTDWRNKWQQGDIPFLYVQLPNFMEVRYLPAESNWAELRFAQLKALSVPNTAMAVGIDAGEWNDIHPLEKKVIGERLALAARKLAYGEENIVYSGPIFKSLTKNGNRLIFEFDHTGSGLVVKGGGDLNYFALAGPDKKFLWGNAIIENDHVVVWSEEITDPCHVRYAWADNPESANLYNNEGLPASPFEAAITQ